MSFRNLGLGNWQQVLKIRNNKEQTKGSTQQQLGTSGPERKEVLYIRGTMNIKINHYILACSHLTQNKSQNPTVAQKPLLITYARNTRRPPVASLTSSPTPVPWPLTSSQLASLLLPEHARHPPASGPLHVCVPLPGTVLPQILTQLASPPLSSLCANITFSVVLPLPILFKSTVPDTPYPLSQCIFLQAYQLERYYTTSYLFPPLE